MVDRKILRFFVDKGVLPNGWSHARGNRPKVLVHIKTSVKEQRPDPARAHQRDWHELLSSHSFYPSHIHI